MNIKFIAQYSKLILSFFGKYNYINYNLKQISKKFGATFVYFIVETKLKFNAI